MIEYFCRFFLQPDFAQKILKVSRDSANCSRTDRTFPSVIECFQQDAVGKSTDRRGDVQPTINDSSNLDSVTSVHVCPLPQQHLLSEMRIENHAPEVP